jgi:hypothetical protein
MAETTNRGTRDSGNRDWFIGAIETRGTVDNCLGKVLEELNSRTSFVESLLSNIVGGKAGGDQITEISAKIKSLENTLRFRLGILRPERPGAWFRAPAATSTGPFASTLLVEPVFALYKPEDVDTVRKKLKIAWDKKSLNGLPFDADEACLWRSLLKFSIDLENLNKLAAPFESYSLDSLPEGLTPVLESKALRAFLLNVSSEIKNSRAKLEGCYQQLLDASDRLWIYQKEQSKRLNRRDSRSPGQERIDDVRAEFKKRRNAARPLRNARDLDALDYMGFNEFPSVDGLKTRYLSMAKKLHPDAAGGSDDEFKILTKAYSHLNGRLNR